MFKFLCCISLLVAVTARENGISIKKRVLPINENCNPLAEVCRKGDLIATSIADCKKNQFRTCNAQNDDTIFRTVNLAKGDVCKPISGLSINCGDQGTNTRCVCDDTNAVYVLVPTKFNTCRCQYWPAEDISANSPAACVGHYTGGISGLHHWACCDNCMDPTPNTCDAITWQGGSNTDYCGTCGTNTGRGRIRNYFNCGSCTSQQSCSDECSGLIQSLPGLCWRWLDCFLGCCLRITQQPSGNKRQVDASFCGDGTCNTRETTDSCPTDCCPEINSRCFANNSDICELACCGESTCCLDSNSAATRNATPITAALLILLALIVQHG